MLGSLSGMELDLKDWSESGHRLHLEAGIKASLKWTAARAVCTDPGVNKYIKKVTSLCESLAPTSNTEIN